jgi:uncharacterized protein YjbI with pentapeptide repeats
MSRGAKREPGCARDPVGPAGHDVDDALRDRLVALDEPLRLTDVVVRDGDLSNLQLRGSELRRVAIERTRMLGVDAARAEAQDVRVSGASLQLALFTEATLTRVTFERVDLREAAFAGARLQDVLFADCRLDGADFREVRTRGCAVRGCTLDGAEGLAELLRGTSMPWPDVVHSAGALAQALGVTIED